MLVIIATLVVLLLFGVMVFFAYQPSQTTNSSTPATDLSQTKKTKPVAQTAEITANGQTIAGETTQSTPQPATTTTNGQAKSTAPAAAGSSETTSSSKMNAGSQERVDEVMPKQDGPKADDNSGKGSSNHLMQGLETLLNRMQL